MKHGNPQVISSAFDKTKKSEGSADIWNLIWNKLKDSNQSDKCLFTLNTPMTLYQFWQKAYATDLLILLRNSNYVDFLELGAGRATTSMYLNQSGKNNITLIDLSEQAKMTAVENFAAYNLSFNNYLLTDVRQTGLNEETFDCIYNIGLLEHFDQPLDVLRESYRLLRKGGMIFMPVFPDYQSGHSRLLRFFLNPVSLFLKLFRKKNENEMIRTVHNRKYYEDLCHQAGFVDIQCCPYNQFPKIIRSGWYERNIILRLYKWYYAVKQKKEKDIILKTNAFCGSAILVLAYK
jgi:ubiquinone/menaquinone biosynthesis C-methylase UbiE